MVHPWRWGVLFCGTALGVAHAAFDARPLVTVYSSEAIGQDAMSWATVEDADHGLHFGANTLISFDGAHWRSDPAGQSYALRGLDVDPSGKIWAAGSGEIGWFDRRPDGGWQFHSLVGHLAAADRDLGEMWQAYGVPGGAVFAGANALYWWDGSALSVQRFPGSRRMAAMRSTSGIYVCQAATGLWQVDRARKICVVPADQLGGATVLWLEEQPATGQILLATSRGFWTAAGGRATPIFPEASECVRQFGVTTVLRLTDGRLALGTLRGGIIILDKGGRVTDRFSRQNGLPTDEIFSLYADHDGGLWATSSANLFRVSLLGFRWYRDAAGTGDEPCVAIARGPDGLLFATDTGLFRADFAGEHLLPVGGTGRHNWTLAPAGPSLLVGRDGGVDRFEGNRSESIYEGASDVAAVQVEAGRETAVIAAGQGLWRIAWRARNPPVLVAKASEAPTTLALGAGGEIWVGTTTRGVLHGVISPDAPVQLREPPFARGSGPGAVAAAPDGAVYAFAQKAGWRIAPAAGAKPIRDFPRRDVSAALAGPAGVWIAHPAEGTSGACLAEIKLEAAGPRWEPRLIEGLWRVGIPEALHAENHHGRVRLWIGGTSGILRCDLDVGGPRVALPQPVLALRRQDGIPVTSGERLPYSAGDLLLSANVSSYALRPALIIETKIDPVDSAWQPLDPSGGRRLVALRDGKYVVRARVRASTGEWSAAAKQAVTILPPWWRTGAALGAFVLLAGAFAYGLHRWNSRALRRRAQQLERTVEGRTREAESANAEKTRFVAGISHDIRNPLNGIVGLTLALEDSELNARQRELTRAMRGCAKYLDGLVDEVIDFAQIESGHAAVRPEWYEVGELLEDVVAITRAEAEIDQARVAVHIGPGVPVRLWGDAARVRQILVNLTFNAIRHAGGNIELRAGRTEWDGRDAIEFSVVDFGPGIAPHDQARLFEPFSRIEGGQRRRVPGSGLGLATSKRWAEAMDGRVRVASTVGRGSRFDLCLPLAASAPPETARAAGAGLRRVLVVEDEDYNAWAIAAVAARVGVIVTARASSGAEALQLFAPGRFDGILLDRLLPDMDGTKVARAIRAAGDAAVKIIALTAGATAEDRAACLAAGMDAFIGKPLTPEKLLAALNQWKEPPATAPAAFDLRLIHFLSDGTLAGQAMQLERYAAHLSDAHDALRLALTVADARAIRECAHRLHGHVRMIEAQEAAEAAAKIESAAQRGELPDAEALADLDAAVGRLRSALSQVHAPLQNLAPGHIAAARSLNPGPVCARD